MLTSALVLTLPEGTKGFVIYGDASRFVLACVRIKHGNVITYASRQLKVHVKNYTTYDLDLPVVVFAFKIWRNYINRIHVDFHTDHESLQYIFTQNELNLRKRRWLELLKEYVMSVLYYPVNAN